MLLFLSAAMLSTQADFPIISALTYESSSSRRLYVVRESSSGYLWVVNNVGSSLVLQLVWGRGGSVVELRTPDKGDRVRTPRPPYRVLEQDTLRFPKFW